MNPAVEGLLALSTGTEKVAVAVNVFYTFAHDVQKS